MISTLFILIFLFERYSSCLCFTSKINLWSSIPDQVFLRDMKQSSWEQAPTNQKMSLQTSSSRAVELVATGHCSTEMYFQGKLWSRSRKRNPLRIIEQMRTTYISRTSQVWKLFGTGRLWKESVISGFGCFGRWDAGINCPLTGHSVANYI